MEFVGVMPVLLAIGLALAQLVVVGWGLWSASLAARAGARASLVDGDVRRAAMSALPRTLQERARIGEGASAIHVRVPIPALLPGLPDIPVDARTALAPAAGLAGPGDG